MLCNGWSRRELLEKFVDSSEKEEDSRIVSLDMRPLHKFNLLARFENGAEKMINGAVCGTFVCNKANYIEKCAACGMHTAGNGKADLTIGDFWNYGKHKDVCDQKFAVGAGTNIVFVNTERGRKMFNKIKPDAEWRYLS